MALAPGTGYDVADLEDDFVPMAFTSLGTSLSQLSSWRESSCLLSVYQEPAWEAWRVVIVSFGLV
jgi:hypothetical protein